jgi:hypothetical protein
MAQQKQKNMVLRLKKIKRINRIDIEKAKQEAEFLISKFNIK